MAFTDKQTLLLCRLQFDFTALISHLYWATSQSRSAKQTIKPLLSSLLPSAAQGLRSVRGRHVHNLCSAGQWLCVTCAWDSEGHALVRSVCEAGAWGGSWRFSRDTVDMLVHTSVSCYFLKALIWVCWLYSWCLSQSGNTRLLYLWKIMDRDKMLKTLTEGILLWKKSRQVVACMSYGISELP